MVYHRYFDYAQQPCTEDTKNHREIFSWASLLFSFFRSFLSIILFFVLRSSLFALNASGLDSIPTQSIVFVEGSDSAGNKISMGIGVIVKDGYVALNYHKVASMAQLVVYRTNEEKKYFSDGYLDLDSENDMIIISVPYLKGKVAPIFPGDSVKVGSKVNFFEDPLGKKLYPAEGTLKGRKEIEGRMHFEVVSKAAGDAFSGPVFFQGQLAGFITCGYRDMRYFAFYLPTTKLPSLLKRSMIIKDYSFLQPGKKPGASLYQQELMASLNSVLWLNFEDAIKLAAKKKKKIIVDVYTNWCGWCKLMEKNAFGKKGIIGYVNENFYSVRLNAETTDTVEWKGNEFAYANELRCNALAWVLLKGNMNYPALVFLDETGEIITTVPGYMDSKRLEVVLHFFMENAYLKPGASFQDFEIKYWQRVNRENGD